MKKHFGHLPDGREAFLYTLTGGGLTAEVSDFGATLVRLFVPDRHGRVADVVLGFEDPKDYIGSNAFFGTVVGRNANRVKNAVFSMNDRVYPLHPNDNGRNNLHSGPNAFKNRLWSVEEIKENQITLGLNSPDGDQGFPGNATIRVTYTLEADATLRIRYTGICDKDTVFNFTNHSYFNLAGHDKPEKAISQMLTLPARVFTPADSESIPTGEIRSVSGTPMDFRVPKAIGRDLDANYGALLLQGGYDHNFEVFTSPCAILSDPESGRTMAVSTDCPGIQVYSGNYLAGEIGKDGVSYCRRGGVCLETQFYPDAVNHPEWKQPFIPAGMLYHTETTYRFR